MIVTSRLTAKYQATVPTAVRKVLKLKQGDRVVFDIKKDKVALRKATPLDLGFLRSLQHTLTEWNSDHDEKAYGEL